MYCQTDTGLRLGSTNCFYYETNKSTTLQLCHLFTFDWRRREKIRSKLSLFSWTNVVGLLSNKMMRNLRTVQTIPIRLISPPIRSNSIRKRFLCTANKSTNEQHERTASFGFQTVLENEKAEKGSLIWMLRPFRFCYLKLSDVAFVYSFSRLFVFYFIFIWILFELKFNFGACTKCTKCLKMWQPHMI